MWIFPSYLIVLRAVFAFVSSAFLVRFMIILRKCNNLHPNCKLFMLGIAMALIFPVTASLVEVVVVNFVHEMEDGLLQSFNHYVSPMLKTSFGMTSLLFLSIAIERLCACLNAPKYSIHLHAFALFGLSVSIVGSSVFVYAEQSDIYFPISILFILSAFDILALVMCIFTSLWAFYKFRTTEYVLNSRVQLTEVIQVSKCVLPSLILGIPIKLSEPILALYDIVDTRMTSATFLLYSILVPLTIMLCNREMRGHFIPCCRSKLAEINNKKRDSEKYFNHFNKTIHVKKQPPVKQSAKVNTYRI